LIRRNFVITARRSGLFAAAAAHATVTAFYLEAWGEAGGAPIAGGANIFEQLLLVQFVLMALVAPWVAARVVAGETRVDLARLSIQYGVLPGTLWRGRLMTVIAWIVVVQLAGVPAAIEAQQMSALSVYSAAEGQLALLCVALAGGLLSCATAARIDVDLIRWLFPAATLLLILTAVV
jgi:hypothetical protein